MKRMTVKRILSIALAGVIAFSNMNITAFATGFTNEVVLEETAEVVTENEYFVEEECIGEVTEKEIVIEEENIGDITETEVAIEENVDEVTETEVEVENEEQVEKITDDEYADFEDEYMDYLEEPDFQLKEETDRSVAKKTEEIVEEQEVTEEEEYLPEVPRLEEEAFIETLEETEDEKVHLSSDLEEMTDWGDILLEEDRLLYATESMPEGNASLVPAGLWVAGVKAEGYTYTGTNIIFGEGSGNAIRVYDGKKLLRQNVDYTISYKNNKNAYELREEDPNYSASKAPAIILKGKGNYSGSLTENFVIRPKNLSEVYADGSPVFQAPDITLVYNGKVQKGTTKVTYVNEKGKTVTLKNKTDFTYVYPGTDKNKEGYDPLAFKEAKDTPYTVIIEGTGNYTGTLEFKETITQGILLSKVKVSALEAQMYTGEEVKPELSLTYKGEKLTPYNEETEVGDYVLEYKNNTKPGTAMVVITGKGKYVGTRTVTFFIGYDLKKVKIKEFQKSVVYPGDDYAQAQAKLLYTIGKGKDAETIELEEGTHYKAIYIQFVEAGTATVVYTGIEESGFTGTIKKTYKIVPYDISKDPEKRITVTDGDGNLYPQETGYVKGGAKPEVVVKFKISELSEVVLIEGIDYVVGYTNNKGVNDGSNKKKLPTIKITGKGNFKGTRSKDTFKITGSDISSLTLAAADKEYSKKNKNYTTSVQIVDTDGKKLSAGKDYEKQLKYYYYEDVLLENGDWREAGEEVGNNDIVPIGTSLMVVATGKGAYRGSEEEAATISGRYKVVQKDISKATVKIEKQYYNGKEIRPDKSQLIVTLKGNVLNDSDYEIVSYGNNQQKGKATLTIKGVGNYGGIKNVNFTIIEKSMYCTLSYHPNGANSGSMQGVQLKVGQSYSLAKNTYQKKGYRFIGWNTKADGSGTDKQGNVVLYTDTETRPVEIEKTDMGKHIVLYAQWEIIDYKVTYKLQGGINSESNPAAYTVNDEIELQEARKEGVIFAGWYTDSKCTEAKKITKISKGTTGNLVLYAKWRATFLGTVEKPEEGTYLNVLDYGAVPNDSLDDTNAIERAVSEASENYKWAEAESEEALENVVNTVYVPEGIYTITAGHAHNDGDPGISMKSNVKLILDEKAVLRVEASAYGDYCVISAKNVENITIKGGKIEGERYRHLGKGGEGGHGIALYGARNVEISNISVASNWGDGIYLGTQAVRQPDKSQKYLGCDNVLIQNCDIFDNRRSNMSVTDADNLTIDHCYIFDAHGTAPQCGICIEPNSNSSGDRICRNIVLRDTTITAYQNKNDSEYMCLMTHHNPYVSGFTTSDGIWFKNCTFNGWVGNYSGKNLHYDDKTVFNGEFVNLR